MSQICPNCGFANSATASSCSRCGNTFAPGAAGQAMPGTGMLPPNAVLSNRYIVLRKVGQGGMGAVYQVADSRIPGKTWAVKEMSDANLATPQERQQAVQAFEREAQLLSQLSHLNIPRVFDYFSQNGKQYLAMEFVEGETLEEIMDRRAGPLSEAEVRPRAEQLCEVLDYLHSRQPPVIFRDLKPANIMIDRDGHVKLIDFGIVRFFQPGKAKDTTSFGTVGYAPPEQYGKGQTDARSDLYALAATLHQLLTGRDPALKPFQFQPVRTLNPRVSETMEKVLAKALELDPVRRWQDAKAMQRALNAPAAQPAAPAATQQAPSPAQVPATPSYSPPVHLTPPPMPAVAPQPAPSPQQQPPAAKAVAGQAAKTAAQKSWEVNKQGMGALGRLVTGGGRAAYTELFKPTAIIEGYVTNIAAPAGVPAPFEWAAFVFVAVLFFGWLVFLFFWGWLLMLILLGAWIGLLVLSRLGVRRPYFSRLTLIRLRSLMGDKSKGQVQLAKFTVDNYHTGQPVEIVMIGPKAGPQPAPGHWVRVWGIPEAGLNQVRAWQIEVVEQSGRSLGLLRADRLIPLGVALFWPLAMFTLAFLTMVIIGGGGTP